MLKPEQWHMLRSKFVRDYCSVMGLSCESPLFVAITCGLIALPTLLKLSSVLQKKRPDLTVSNTLTTEIELGDEFAFHSIFACPVSRAQSTAYNPPMLLSCGHVISQVSLKNLERGYARSVKCPYCPTEQISSEAREIYF